jgi:hypothetical protein
MRPLGNQSSSPRGLQSSRGVVAGKRDPARIDFITKRQYERRKAGLSLSCEISRLGLPFVLNNALGSPRCFQGYRRFSGNRFPPKRLAKASASSGLPQQNTTKSLSSRRREYVSGVADRTPAAQNITAGDFAFAAGHLRIAISAVARTLNSAAAFSIAVAS